VWDSLDAKACEKRVREVAPSLPRGAEAAAEGVHEWVAQGEEFGMLVPYALTLRADGTCTYAPREAGRPGAIEGTWSIGTDGLLWLRRKSADEEAWPGEGIFGLYRLRGNEIWGFRSPRSAIPEYILGRR